MPGPAGARLSADRVPWTMLRGAWTNTNTLAVVPTSCGRGWICAVTFAVAGVTMAVTVIGKTGGGAMLALNVPLVANVPSTGLPPNVNVPVVPFQKPE